MIEQSSILIVKKDFNRSVQMGRQREEYYFLESVFKQKVALVVCDVSIYTHLAPTAQ